MASNVTTLPHEGGSEFERVSISDGLPTLKPVLLELLGLGSNLTNIRAIERVDYKAVKRNLLRQKTQPPDGDHVQKYD